MKNKVCKFPNCGEEFTPNVHNQKYCSSKCKQKAENKAKRLTPEVETLSPEEILRDEVLKLRSGEDKRLVQELVSKASFVQIAVEALKEAIEPVKNFSTPKIVSMGKRAGDAEEAVLIISDAQIGKVTATYDSEVFIKRVAAMRDATLKIAGIMRNDHPIETLNIFWLGDIPDGQLIYPTQSHHVDQSAVNQIFRSGLPAFVDMLTSFSSSFKQVNNYCVRGNHGRTGKFADERSNWDIVIYEALRLATTNMANVGWSITDDWHQIVDILSWKFLITHGHQIKMWMNIPHYGITNKGMRWQGSVGKFHYLCLGHFHTVAMSDWNEWEMIINGTFVSNDDWAVEVLGLQSTPKQLLFFVHPKKGITARYKIYL